MNKFFETLWSLASVSAFGFSLLGDILIEERRYYTLVGLSALILAHQYRLLHKYETPPQ